MDNNKANTTTCPQCGATFTCNPSGCWCFNLPPVMPVAIDAQCLCPKCLRKAIDTQKENGII